MSDKVRYWTDTTPTSAEAGTTRTECRHWVVTSSEDNTALTLRQALECRPSVGPNSTIVAWSFIK